MGWRNRACRDRSQWIVVQNLDAAGFHQNRNRNLMPASPAPNTFKTQMIGASPNLILVSARVRLRFSDASVSKP